MKQGQFELYTGPGKGKTTASAGLAIRALGAGFRVFFGQFIKDSPSGEVEILRTLPGMEVRQFGTGRGMLLGREEDASDTACAREGLRLLREALESGAFDMVIADEINVAWSLGLLTDEEYTSLPCARPENVELVFTGRGAPDFMIQKADLVTEMREVKHYYNTKKLYARKGIEY